MKHPKKVLRPNVFIIFPDGRVHYEGILQPPSEDLLSETIGGDFKIFRVPLLIPSPAGVLAKIPLPMKTAQVVISSTTIVGPRKANRTASIIAGRDVSGVAILLLGRAKVANNLVEVEEEHEQS